MRKLLVVDDNAELLFAMESLLSFYGFTVKAITGSKTLMDDIVSFNPEIIIIDVLLCGEDGRNVCKQVRDTPSCKEVTLILFSASPRHLLDFKAHGADGAIEKPFGIKELIENIEAAVQTHKEYLINIGGT